MTNKELYYKQLLRQYDLKRSAAHQAKLKRTAEIYEKIPRIKKIDETLNDSGVKLVRSMLSPQGSQSIEDFRSHTDELIRTKKMLLVEAGYTPHYLEPHYDCEECKDKGFVGNKSCNCFRQALINIAYEQSNLKHILNIENFDHFTLDYYSKEIDPKAGTSPYNNMYENQQVCAGLIEKFETEKQNLLLYGPTGLGKTFLCNCIAKELLDQGYTVLYFTAPQLFKLFEESRFHREDMQEASKETLNTLFDVDLLIIDDLGTESVTTLTISDLFNVINSRYLNQTSTIISTNLTPKEWKDRYSERIVSRVFGNYEPLKFIGTDIRMVKKYGKTHKK